MKYQRVVSLSLGLAFVVMFLSSGVLYFIPDRGATAWSGWSFLGLDKQQWDNLHINLGLLFLAFLVWHIYYNWKPIKNYLKQKRKWVLFTPEFNLSMALVSLFVVGTIWMILPFSFLVNMGNGIKAINAKNRGTAPFAYAEQATLRDFIRLSHLERTSVMEKLESHNIHYRSPRETIGEIALQNSISPKALYGLIRTDKSHFRLPNSIPVGIAHKSLAVLSGEYIFDAQRAVEYMQNSGIRADTDTPFKKIAKSHTLHPATLYAMLLASQIASP